MSKKYRMIVIFSVFLLVVVVFGAFVYKVSKSAESSEQSERQTKKIEINFFSLEPAPSLGKIEKTEALFEFENDKIIIPLEVGKFKEFGNGGYFREQRWIEWFRIWANCL